MDQQGEEMTIASVMETSSKYGRDFALLMIVLGACGTGLMTVWNWVQADMKEQDARIAESDEFIREKLITALAETQNMGRQCTAVIEENTDSHKDNTRAFERNTEALNRINAQMSARPLAAQAPLN